MEMTRLSRVTAASALFACALLVPVAASAATCAGASNFDDVAQSASYCSDAQWMANRGITTGCGGTSFCPDQLLPRSQMALFMHRMSNVMQPTFVHTQGTYPALAISTSSGTAVCQSASALAAAVYPRTITITGFATGKNASASLVMKAAAINALNGGNSATIGQYAEERLASASDEGSVPIIGVFDVPANQTFMPGLFVYTAAGSGTVDVICDLWIRVENRNSTTPPY